MPLHFNFPNAQVATEMYPIEFREVAIFHYLRAIYGYDRAKIFVSAEDYEQFLAMPLEGVHRSFQDAVRRILGPDYPFARAA